MRVATAISWRWGSARSKPLSVRSKLLLFWGKPLFEWAAKAILVTSIVASGNLAAQETDPGATLQDLYRVELLFFSPRNPTVREYLDGASAPTVPVGAELLYGVRPDPVSADTGSDPYDGSGANSYIDTSTESSTQPGSVDEAGRADARLKALSLVQPFSRELVPANRLHLSQARDRLRRSGRYDVHFLVGWKEAFPVGHTTPPLLVRVGDSRGGHADIEGFIQIERQRYLHVNAQLYDLDLTPTVQDETVEDQPANLLFSDIIGEDTGMLLLESQTAPTEEGRENANGPDIISWMNETRRMRSGKLHFLDAPTMGLLVYFEPLD